MWSLYDYRPKYQIEVQRLSLGDARIRCIKRFSIVKLSNDKELDNRELIQFQVLRKL